jgi:hypothetical protein
MTYNINIINQYIDEGWITKTNHPSLPIAIYNYTRKAQFERYWDSITLACRALVLDNNGNIVAKSFDKFFNLEELKDVKLPNEEFEVYEKLDGSIILAFIYNNEWVFASKSSFTSTHADEAKNLFYELKYDKIFSNLNDITIVFEYISDWNRIVVKYDRSRLVLLSMFAVNLNCEIDLTTIKSIYSGNIDYPKTYTPDSFNVLKNKIKSNEEGYVIRFKNGFRFKIKGEEYVKLHKIITNITTVDIWEALKNNDDISNIINCLPDEFDVWVNQVINDIHREKTNLESEIIATYNTFNLVRDIDGNIITTRKEFALWVLSLDCNYKSALFCLFDNKNYDKFIWEQIKPKLDKPFWLKEVDN